MLIVSSELDEILALSDRILVMFKGRIVAEFDGATADNGNEVGLAMAGPIARERRHERRPATGPSGLSRHCCKRAAPGRAASSRIWSSCRSSRWSWR